MKFKDILQSQTPVLVDFYADWCGPCKIMAPILQQLKSAMGDRIKIIKVDIDKNQTASHTYKITGVPTLIFFVGGKQAWKRSGVIPANELQKMIEPHI